MGWELRHDAFKAVDDVIDNDVSFTEVNAFDLRSHFGEGRVQSIKVSILQIDTFDPINYGVRGIAYIVNEI